MPSCFPIWLYRWHAIKLCIIPFNMIRTMHFLTISQNILRVHYLPSLILWSEIIPHRTSLPHSYWNIYQCAKGNIWLSLQLHTAFDYIIRIYIYFHNIAQRTAVNERKNVFSVRMLWAQIFSINLPNTQKLLLTRVEICSDFPFYFITVIIFCGKEKKEREKRINRPNRFTSIQQLEAGDCVVVGANMKTSYDTSSTK